MPVLEPSPTRNRKVKKNKKTKLRAHQKSPRAERTMTIRTQPTVTDQPVLGAFRVFWREGIMQQCCTAPACKFVYSSQITGSMPHW